MHEVALQHAHAQYLAIAWGVTYLGVGGTAQCLTGLQECCGMHSETSVCLMSGQRIGGSSSVTGDFCGHWQECKKRNSLVAAQADAGVALAAHFMNITTPAHGSVRQAHRSLAHICRTPGPAGTRSCNTASQQSQRTAPWQRLSLSCNCAPISGVYATMKESRVPRASFLAPLNQRLSPACTL